MCNQIEQEQEHSTPDMVCGQVSAELLLEVARACTALISASENIEVEITDEETRNRILRRMSRMEFLFRLVPSVLDCRRIVCLADKAAENPDWWKANRLHFFEPELTYNQIAELLDLTRHQVRDSIRSVNIGTDCYDTLQILK